MIFSCRDESKWYKSRSSNSHNSVVVFPDHGFIRQPTISGAIDGNMIPSSSLYYAFLCFILDCYVSGTFCIKYENIIIITLSHRRKSERKKNPYFVTVFVVLLFLRHVICNCSFWVLHYFNLICFRPGQSWICKK
jgi:hypothetical protein